MLQICDLTPVGTSNCEFNHREQISLTPLILNHSKAYSDSEASF